MRRMATKACQIMERLSSKGRTFVKGRAISPNIHTSIVDEIVRNGGDTTTGYFPGRFSDVANSFKVSRCCVENVWRRLHTAGTVEPRKHAGGNPSNLTQGDLQFIETCKIARPTSSLREIFDGLNEFGDIPNGTSIPAISRALRNKMLSGLKYPGKKIRTVAQERFGAENIAYTQMFIDYLHAQNPYKLKFFNECETSIAWKAIVWQCSCW